MKEADIYRELTMQLIVSSILLAAFQTKIISFGLIFCHSDIFSKTNCGLYHIVENEFGLLSVNFAIITNFYAGDYGK